MLFFYLKTFGKNTMLLLEQIKFAFALVSNLETLALSVKKAGARTLTLGNCKLLVPFFVSFIFEVGKYLSQFDQRQGVHRKSLEHQR